MSSCFKILQVCAIDTSVEMLKPLILRAMSDGYIVHTVCTDTGAFKDLRSQGLLMFDITIDRRIHLLKNAKSVYKLCRLMKSEKYDIVHVHTPIAALIGRVAAKLAGVKTIIYTAHGFYFHDDMSKIQYKIYYLIEKYAARFLTDWLLLQSKEDYELALKDSFVKTEQIIHLSNGVDIWNIFNPHLITKPEIEQFLTQERLSKGDFIFSFIGRMVREKGVFELVEAFKRVESEYPYAKLLLIGGFLESERDQDSYNQLLKEFEHECIRFLGFREDIPLLMQASTVYVLPSHREGLPRSIIEAMAMEKPIIATNIRGCREEVFNEENGYLVEKNNVDELTRSMKEMISNPELVKQFGTRSREIAEELFDEENVLKKQIILFNKLLKTTTY
jgi:glycosyltransferase involved in cell wall biosynthesis